MPKIHEEGQDWIARILFKLQTYIRELQENQPNRVDNVWG
jgi:hypothetical protein